MKRVIMFLGCLAWVNIVSARVYLCKEGDPGHCERIDQVLIDGEWVEANCDNVDVPDGWYIDCCC